MNNAEIPSNKVVRDELSGIIPRIAAILAETVGVDFCGFFVYDESLRHTIAVFRHGYDDEHLQRHEWTSEMSPWDIPIEAEVLRTGNPVQRTRPEDFERLPMATPGQEVGEGRLCDLVVPLLWRDRVQGVAQLWSRNDPRPFTDDQITMVEDIAAIAAMAVAFARQYGEERRQRQQLDALLDVASLAASPLSVDELVPHLTHAIRSAIGTDVCNLYVYDNSGEHVLAGFSDGLNDRELIFFDETTTYPVSDVPVEARMRHSHEPQVITDLDAELVPESELVAYARDVGIKAILVVPILYRHEMVGVVYSWYRDTDQPFTVEAIATVQAIANQAGGVISRARLHEASQQHIEEIEALLKIGQGVLTSDTLEPVLDQIADALAHAVPYDYSFVALKTDNEQAVHVFRDWGRYPGTLTGEWLPMHGSLTGHVVATGRLISTPDVLREPDAKAFEPVYPQIRSVIVSPLNTDHGTIGALFLGRYEIGRFTSRQRQLMSLLSQQAAVAIERVKAREAIAAHAARQSFLASVVERLLVEDDPRSALEEITSLAAGTLADGVMVGLTSWGYGSIEWVHASHRDPSTAARLNEALTSIDRDAMRDRFEEVVQSGRATIYTAAQIEKGYPELGHLLREFKVNEVGLFPLYQPERSHGLLVLLDTDTRTPFDEDTNELARIVAQRIGEALQRKQMQRNRESLLRVSNVMNTQVGLIDVLRAITSELYTIIPYENLVMAEADADAAVFRPHLYVNVLGSTDSDWTMPLDEGLCGAVYRTKQPILENHAHLRSESRYSEDVREYVRQHGESVMAAPLTVDNEVTGILFIGRSGAGRFTESEFETFLLFAGLASSAYHRVRLTEYNQTLYRASVEVLAAVVDAKDPTTLEHSRKVAHYCRVGAELMGCSTDEIERIELAGLLHDIGKLGIPDRVLGKPGKLTEDEFALIKTHPDRGAAILRQHPALAPLIPLVRHHHERFDGTGYPCRLEGDEIPIGASIIAIADAFDTMISERTYQRQRSVEEALRELEVCAGTQFHPDIAVKFVETMRREPILPDIAPRGAEADWAFGEPPPSA